MLAMKRGDALGRTFVEVGETVCNALLAASMANQHARTKDFILGING